MLIGLLAGTFACGVRADAFDRTWCELDAGDFRLITDRSRSDAEDLARHLHTFRPVAEEYLPGAPNAHNPPLTVLVFGHLGDYRRVMHAGEMVGFMQPSLTENLMVVGPNPTAHSEYEPLFHEYVHYLLRTRTDVNIPAWFDEGLASMLSLARIAPGRVIVGEAPEDVLERSIRNSGLSLDDVLSAEDVWDWSRERRLGFYAWSWVLVHRLMLAQQAGRTDFRPALRAVLDERQPSLPAAVHLSSAALERRLLRYLQHRLPTVVQESPGDGGPEGSYHCLAEPESVRRISMAIVQHNPKEAVRHLRTAVAQHPDRSDLWIALSVAQESAGNRDATLVAARRAVALAADDVSAAVQLASALSMGCIFTISEECRARWQEAVPLLRRSLARDPTRQDAIFVLGLAYLYSGRAGDALNYLRIAHQRQPWAPHVNFYLGEAYRLIGDSRAREHLARAKRWSPTELWRKLADAGLEQLQADR